MQFFFSSVDGNHYQLEKSSQSWLRLGTSHREDALLQFLKCKLSKAQAGKARYNLKSI